MSPMNTVSDTTLEPGGTIVEVKFDDGQAARFHALWLRDNAADGGTGEASNGQRLHTLTELPAGITVTRARADAGDLLVRFAPGGHQATFAGGWLRAHRYDRASARPPHGEPPPWVRTWDAALGNDLPSVEFTAARDDRRALVSWLACVRCRGFAMMTGVPKVPGTLEQVVRLFGHVRETNYGRLFDVRVEPTPANLAYTGLGLQVHTDNPYRDPVPTLQLLHCLRGAADGDESVVVDGFSALQRLRLEAPAQFDLLASHCVPFHFDGRGDVRLRAREPVIRLTADGELRGLRFNNRSSGPLQLPFDVMPHYYAALRQLAEILEDPALAVTFKLSPGDLFIVDNERVLHGRRAYRATGGRHLQGCYADRDGLYSRLAVLEAELANTAELK